MSVRGRTGLHGCGDLRIAHRVSRSEAAVRQDQGQAQGQAADGAAIRKARNTCMNLPRI